jgi:hypothetical protein
MVEAMESQEEWNQVRLEMFHGETFDSTNKPNIDGRGRVRKASTNFLAGPVEA